MTDIFEAKERLLQDLKWNENPFVKDLRVFDRESFVKHYCPFESTAILQKLAFDAKACLLTGPKGVGKTSALYHVFYSLPEDSFLPILLKEPPASVDALAREMGLVKQNGLVDGLLSVFRGKKIISREELARRVKAVDRKVVLFVDEAHLVASKEMYMEFKYLLDEASNLRLVLSSLGQEGFPDSLMHLIGSKNVFTRKNFSRDEMKRIIEHRISAVGGKGVAPFDDDFIGEVFTEQNLLTPRYVFDELNAQLAKIAAGEAVAAEEEEVEEHVEHPYARDAFVMDVVQRAREDKITTAHAEWWVMLSPSQQGVMKLLLTRPEGVTLNEIIAELKLAQNTCFNALYQLRGEDDAELKRKPEVPFPLVEVKPKLVGGRKKNIYFVNAKVRNIFTLH